MLRALWERLRPRRSRSSHYPLLVAGALVGTLPAGCYSPKGGMMPASTGAWTYPSTETMPKTVTLVNTATNEVIWFQAIPPGQQLTLQFLSGGGDDPVNRPDRMIWELQPLGTQTGRLRNQITVPSAAARRIDVNVSQEPEPRQPLDDFRYRTDDLPDERPDYWGPQGGERPRSPRNLYDG